MFLDNKPYDFDRVFRMLFTLAAIVGLVFLAGYLSDALLPFFAALLMAYLMNPLVVFFEKYLKGRALAVLASLLTVALALCLGAWLVLPSIAQEFANAGHVFKGLLSGSEAAQRLQSYLPENVWQYLKEVAGSEAVREYLVSDGGVKLLKTAATKIFPGVLGVFSGAAGLVSIVAGMFVMLLYLVFLLLDFRAVAATWRDYLPPATQESVSSFLEDFSLYMNRYFRAQALVASIVGVLCAVGFWLIGLPMGIVLGLFVGLLNMVPYLQLLAVPPALLLGFVHAAQSGEPVMTSLLLVGLVFIVVQVIQDAVLTPRIMGDVTGLSPAVILLSLSVWGQLLGLLGLLIAIPATCLVLAYYQRYLEKLKKHVA